MVAHQRCLVVFGGFHDNAKKSPKYFGDVHVFDLEKYRFEHCFLGGAVFVQYCLLAAMCAD